MLINTPSPFPTLIALENLKHEFYLTGSRFFGEATLKSEYDFFVQQPTKRADLLKKSLEALGFRELSDTTYTDSQTIAVFRRHSTATEQQIDVQLVKDAKLKLLAQTIIQQGALLTQASETLNKSYSKSIDVSGFDSKVALELSTELQKALASIVWNTVIATLAVNQNV